MSQRFIIGFEWKLQISPLQWYQIHYYLTLGSALTMCLNRDRRQRLTSNLPWGWGWLGGGNIENQGPYLKGYQWILVWDTLNFQKILVAHFSSKMPTGWHDSGITAQSMTPGNCFGWHICLQAQPENSPHLISCVIWTAVIILDFSWPDSGKEEIYTWPTKQWQHYWKINVS